MTSSLPRGRGMPVETFEVLLTAAEAFPVFERLMLGARREVRMGFRIFELDTRLRSEEARAIGETWFDLLVHTLERGVNVWIHLTDFDPILATDLHRKSWRSAKQFAAADEVAEGGTLYFHVAPHPARVGLVPKLVLRGKVMEKLEQRGIDEYAPGLRPRKNGKIELIPATHHQKLAVFDGETLYIGGLDLDERRYDEQDHDRPAEKTWHDVQAVATGPVAAAAEQHLRTLEDTVGGRMAPPPTSPGFLRTLSARRRFEAFHISPRTVVSEIEDQHCRALERVKGMVYCETQFFRHLPLADALARAGQADGSLCLIMVLPAAPEDVAFDGNDGADARFGEQLQAEAVSRVREAFGERAVFCTPAQHRRSNGEGRRAQSSGAPIVYVHAKVSVFGSNEAILSSANLNGRSLKWDTEAGLHLTDRDQVCYLRDRLMRHWMPEDTIFDDDRCLDTVSAWRRTVLENGRRAPQERRGFLVPYDAEEAREFGVPAPGVPDEIV